MAISLPRKITSKWLNLQDACPEHVERFAKEWPYGVLVSKKALVHASELGLDIGWLAKKTMPRELYDVLCENTSPLTDAYWLELAPIYRALDDDILKMKDYSGTESKKLFKNYRLKRDALYANCKNKRDVFVIEALWHWRTSGTKASDL